MSGGGKSTPATTTVVQQAQNDPWAPLVPHLTSLFTQGQAAVGQTPRTADQIYAGPNQDQLTAVNQMRDAAGKMTGAEDMRALATATARGDYLNPETNPWLARTGEVIQNTANENLLRNVLPALADRAILGGAYGGSNYGVSQGVAAGDNQRAIADALTGMYGQNYQLERDRQLGSGSLFNQANELALAGPRVLDNIGQQQQAWEQARLAAQMEAPWAGLDRYAALLGLGGRYGTSSGTDTTTSTAARAGGGASFLQGATGGAAAGSAFGPWGAGIGGILGGLGGLIGR